MLKYTLAPFKSFSFFLMIILGKASIKYFCSPSCSGSNCDTRREMLIILTSPDLSQDLILGKNFKRKQKCKQTLSEKEKISNPVLQNMKLRNLYHGLAA